MSLKKVFSAMKREGYVVKPLEMYLLSLSAKDTDRAINVNAPSAIGTCMRARYYSRIGAPCDVMCVDARTRRIFDNGTHVHIRLQDYLKECGILKLDEVPVISTDYTIQGHTDGIIVIDKDELGVLEIKSINSRSFSELRCEKPEHKRQGLIYLFCLEERRKYLRETYQSDAKFIASQPVRRGYYQKLYSYLKDGSKHTREEKISFQVRLGMTSDSLLFHCEKPITKVVFVYENKDTQDLKEYTVERDAASESIIQEMLSECLAINEAVELKKVPKRCASSKSDNACRWCNYKTECWN